MGEDETKPAEKPKLNARQQRAAQAKALAARRKRDDADLKRRAKQSRAQRDKERAK